MRSRPLSTRSTPRPQTTFIGSRTLSDRADQCHAGALPDHHKDPLRRRRTCVTWLFAGGDRAECVATGWESDAKLPGCVDTCGRDGDPSGARKDADGSRQRTTQACDYPSTRTERADDGPNGRRPPDCRLRSGTARVRRARREHSDQHCAYNQRPAAHANETPGSRRRFQPKTGTAARVVGPCAHERV
jgi:hypothetical protein